MDWLQYCGTGIALLGSALAVGFACAGSGKGVGLVGEAGAGVLSQDPSKFSQILILQVIPGTQGLYGLVTWFYALMQMGFFNGTMAQLDLTTGLMYFAACLPIAIGGYHSAIGQGRVAAASVSMIAKRPGELTKGIIMAIMVEFYAILTLLASFLMLNSLG